MKQYTELEEELTYALLNSLTRQQAIDLFRSYFFVCPRCGVVYDREIGKYGGLCCNRCITDEDLANIEKSKQEMIEQLKELNNEK